MLYSRVAQALPMAAGLPHPPTSRRFAALRWGASGFASYGGVFMKLLRKSLCLVLILALLQLSAFASVYQASNGSTQYAYATSKLALRVEPFTTVTDLGTYPVSGSYIRLSGRYWDSSNSIWWVRCSFDYNGQTITGWTGAKRFDSSSYDLYALPEYLEGSGLFWDDWYPDYDYDDACEGYAQWAYATMKLSLRSEPSTSARDLGTYNMADSYVLVSARHWDSVNSIWWLECSFEYNGSWITGWTGAKRFDVDSYVLNALPQY